MYECTRLRSPDYFVILSPLGSGHVWCQSIPHDLGKRLTPVSGRTSVTVESYDSSNVPSGMERSEACSAGVLWNLVTKIDLIV